MSKEEKTIEEQVAKVLGKEDGGVFTADPNRYEDDKNPVLNEIWRAIDSGIDLSDGRTLKSLAISVSVIAFLHATRNANGKEIVIPSKKWRLDIAAQMVIHTIDTLDISMEDEKDLTAAFRWIKAAADKILNGADAAIKA
jgi:hypothetical protein